MLIANTALLKRVMDCVRDNELDSSLKRILEDGVAAENSCIFLKNLRHKNLHIVQSDFQDKTGFECFINAIHIDDYSKSGIIEQALLYIQELLSKLSQFTDLAFSIIAAETDSGVSVRFHVLRDDENWIAPSDMDILEESILIVHSR